MMGGYSEKMKVWLEDKKVEAEFLSFDRSVHTVSDAVEVSGYPVERFTKSIVMLTSTNDVVIVVVPADCRASTERVRKVLNLDERPRTATAFEIEHSCLPFI